MEKVKIIKLMISYECVGGFWFYQYMWILHITGSNIL